MLIRNAWDAGPDLIANLTFEGNSAYSWRFVGKNISNVTIRDGRDSLRRFRIDSPTNYYDNRIEFTDGSVFNETSSSKGYWFPDGRT